MLAVLIFFLKEQIKEKMYLWPNISVAHENSSLTFYYSFKKFFLAEKRSFVLLLTCFSNESLWIN